METAGTWLTQDIASKICSTVFDPDTIEQLKITIGNGDAISLNQQFYVYFKGQILKYDFQDLIIRAAQIFDYAKQEVKKFVFAKKQLDKLNDPISFFNLNINDNKGSSVNASVNVSNATNKGKNNSLNYSRGNTANIASADAVARAGASQLNEEYTGIEEHWRKEDAKYNKVKQETAKETLDINIPKDLEDIDLQTVLTNTDNLVLTKEPEAEEDIQAPEISYTGINLNKSASSSASKNTNTNKGLNLNATKSTNESNAVNSGLNTTSNQSSNMSFVYGDATYKALGLYVSNFREAFLSSFSSLFIEPWIGY